MKYLKHHRHEAMKPFGEEASLFSKTPKASPGEHKVYSWINAQRVTTTTTELRQDPRPQFRGQRDFRSIKVPFPSMWTCFDQGGPSEHLQALRVHGLH